MKTKRTTPIRRYSPDLAPNPVTPVHPVETGTDANSAANDHLVITGFCGLGIPASDIQPRVNVLTFRKWREAGRQVKRGEHGIKIKGRSGHITVFHISQTERINSKGATESARLPEAPSSPLQPDNPSSGISEPPARKLPAWLRRSLSLPR